MKRSSIFVFLIVLTSFFGVANESDFIICGVPWYDQHDSIVSAHGANIIRDNGKYYMFGEFKTDSVNAFKGFSCYSSPDLVNWTFERIVFKTQPDGRMGPDRVGERTKVLKSPSTGEYVMIMHSDDMRYKDPCVVYATSNTVDGEYEFKGPLLYNVLESRRQCFTTKANITGFPATPHPGNATTICMYHRPTSQDHGANQRILPLRVQTHGTARHHSYCRLKY